MANRHFTLNNIADSSDNKPGRHSGMFDTPGFVFWWVGFYIGGGYGL